MPAVDALGRPPRALKRVDVEHQEHAEDAEVVVDVAEVDDAARDRLEARAAAQKLQRLAAPVAEQARQRIGADEVEGAADQRGDDPADDLVVGARTDEEADGEDRKSTRLNSIH